MFICNGSGAGFRQVSVTRQPWHDIGGLAVVGRPDGTEAFAVVNLSGLLEAQFPLREMHIFLHI